MDRAELLLGSVGHLMDGQWSGWVHCRVEWWTTGQIDKRIEWSRKKCEKLHKLFASRSSGHCKLN